MSVTKAMDIAIMDVKMHFGVMLVRMTVGADATDLYVTERLVYVYMGVRLNTMTLLVSPNAVNTACQGKLLLLKGSVMRKLENASSVV